MYNTERATSGIYVPHQRQNKRLSFFHKQLIFMACRCWYTSEIEPAYQRGWEIFLVESTTLPSSFGGILDVNLTADRLRLGMFVDLLKETVTPMTT